MSLYARGSAALARRPSSASVGAAPAAAATAGGAVSPLVGLGALAALVLGSRWITMRGHRVLLSREGRIEAGDVPQQWQGIHIHDVSPVAGEVRELEEAAEACEAIPETRATFPSIEAGVAALLDANPRLAEFLEYECAGDCRRFRHWVRGGRRGPKPKAHPDEGRFDAINEQFEKRKPGQKVASWLEAVYTTVPKSRRWEDFGPRLEVLSEATGIGLSLPEEAETGAMREEEIAACQAAADERIDDLLARARRGRMGDVEEPAELEEAPF